jgi:tetratricopeptide (TPR) repeat protein
MISHIRALDWDTAIARATRIIDANKPKDGKDVPEDEKKVKLAEAYLYRGIARCFMPGTDSKDGKHNDAVSDLSAALALGAADKAKARYYRAFAYYLDGDYERALADCELCKKPETNELSGAIYRAMGKYEEAVQAFDEALKLYYNGPSSPPPSLLSEYLEARKKMNRA